MLKIIAITATLMAAPTISYANSAAQELCSSLGQLAGLVAITRDLGTSYSDNKQKLLSNGLDSTITDAVLTLVYVDAVNQAPDIISGIMYLGCIAASN